MLEAARLETKEIKIKLEIGDDMQSSDFPGIIKNASFIERPDDMNIPTAYQLPQSQHLADPGKAISPFLRVKIDVNLIRLNP